MKKYIKENALGALYVVFGLIGLVLGILGIYNANFELCGLSIACTLSALAFECEEENERYYNS